MYYISYLFKRVKLRYPSFKKLTMRLTQATRRLHPYFLSHLIVVLPNTLLGHILSHLEATGNLSNGQQKLVNMILNINHTLQSKAQAQVDF